VVYWENADEQNFFDIDDIWMPNGTPNRIGNKKAFKLGFYQCFPGLADDAVCDDTPNKCRQQTRHCHSAVT